MCWAALLHVRTFQEIVVGIQLKALGEDLSAENLSCHQETLMSTSEVRHMRPTARPSTCEVGEDQRSVCENTDFAISHHIEDIKEKRTNRDPTQSDVSSNPRDTSPMQTGLHGNLIATPGHTPNDSTPMPQCSP